MRFYNCRQTEFPLTEVSYRRPMAARRKSRSLPAHTKRSLKAHTPKKGFYKRSFAMSGLFMDMVWNSVENASNFPPETPDISGEAAAGPSTGEEGGEERQQTLHEGHDFLHQVAEQVQQPQQSRTDLGSPYPPFSPPHSWQ